MKIGDAVLVPGDHEGFIYEPGRNPKLKDTFCVYINFGGDGMYVDYYAKNLRPISIGQLTTSMRKDCYDLRQKQYLKQARTEEDSRG